MRFFDVKYGRCEQCGNSGYDQTSLAVISGLILTEYEGKLLCKVCINDLQDKEYGEIVGDKINEDQQFLNSLGVTP